MLCWETLSWVCRVISADGRVLNLTAVVKVVDTVVILIM